MKKTTTTILITLLAAANFGATASTTLPATAPASIASPAPTTNPYLALHGMTADYLVLTNRSIFKKGSQVTDPFAPTTPALPPPPIPHTVAESSLEFNGAIHADASWTAFFENTSSHDVFVKHEGDLIARGKITAITLDSVDYETGGRQNTIPLGHTLDGSEGPGLASAPSLSLSSTQPSGNFTGPNADVLERLRQRRLKEQGQ